MKWKKVLPRESGWFWSRTDPWDRCPVILEVEDRNKKDDGYVWIGNEYQRIFLTPGVRGEDGEPQDDYWMTWEWAGPIPEPEE